MGLNPDVSSRQIPTLVLGLFESGSGEKRAPVPQM